ncbi:MAG: hypothetical protein E6I91_22140 [Chloroflexi bacterium]|nr:MAG: hypothetical protein E6I91_22140 [Chloroflexota bacterium]
MTLFQPPLSERSVTVSVSRALSSGHSSRLSASSDFSATLALRIWRTPWLLVVRPPVPLRPWDGSPIRAFRAVAPTTSMGTPFP